MYQAAWRVVSDCLYRRCPPQPQLAMVALRAVLPADHGGSRDLRVAHEEYTSTMDMADSPMNEMRTRLLLAKLIVRFGPVELLPMADDLLRKVIWTCERNMASCEEMLLQAKDLLLDILEMQHQFALLKQRLSEIILSNKNSSLVHWQCHFVVRMAKCVEWKDENKVIEYVDEFLPCMRSSVWKVHLLVLRLRFYCAKGRMPESAIVMDEILEWFREDLQLHKSDWSDIATGIVNTEDGSRSLLFAYFCILCLVRSAYTGAEQDTARMLVSLKRVTDEMPDDWSNEGLPSGPHVVWITPRQLKGVVPIAHVMAQLPCLTKDVLLGEAYVPSVSALVAQLQHSAIDYFQSLLQDQNQLVSNAERESYVRYLFVALALRFLLLMIADEMDHSLDEEFRKLCHLYEEHKASIFRDFLHGHYVCLQAMYLQHRGDLVGAARLWTSVESSDDIPSDFQILAKLHLLQLLLKDFQKPETLMVISRRFAELQDFFSDASGSAQHQNGYLRSAFLFLECLRQYQNGGSEAARAQLGHLLTSLPTAMTPWALVLAGKVCNSAEAERNMVSLAHGISKILQNSVVSRFLQHSRLHQQ